MTRRHLILVGILFSALILAFFLRDVVERVVIMPLTYLWWILGVYYSILPQFVLWLLLMAQVHPLLPRSRQAKTQQARLWQPGSAGMLH